MSVIKEVLVFIDNQGRHSLVGHLYPHARTGRESATFVYNKKWLYSQNGFQIDPELPLTVGSHQSLYEKSIFGVMSDSAPDRWGRALMRRSEARNSNGPRTLFEIDYLLRVNDEARQGALRYSLPEAPDNYLSPPNTHLIPPLINLPRLLSASRHVVNNSYQEEELKLLLAPGSSLGGARPKASVRDKDGSLAIAKFPHSSDTYDVMAWESVALALAKKSGIPTPNWRLEQVGDDRVLLLNRFDRCKQGRIPYMSAMTLLGARDMEAHSYGEIAEALSEFSESPGEDKRDLWRRMAFNILISNFDDHLRNHGFLRGGRGWRLAPAFDMNPTPITVKARELSTAIGVDEFAAEIDMAIAYAPLFEMTEEGAREVAAEIAGAVEQWRSVAQQVGIASREIEDMASAFEHSELETALAARGPSKT